jgi:hypothetical protein
MSIVTLAAVAEPIEADLLLRLHRAAPRAVANDLGMKHVQIGTGLASVITEPSNGQANLARGFGVRGVIDENQVSAVSDFWRCSGVTSGTFRVAPSGLPADWSHTSSRLGLHRLADSVMHFAHVEDVALRRGDLVVEEVQAEGAELWASTVVHASFPAPTGEKLMGSYADLLAVMASGRCFRMFAVREEGQFIAGAGLLIQGEVACLFGAATIGTHRGRGAHTALVAARAQAAARHRCRWLIAETDKGSSAWRNLNRLGLDGGYDSTNWQWQARATPVSSV